MQAAVGTRAFLCIASTQQQSPRQAGRDRPTMHCCASLQLHCVAVFFTIAVGGHFRNDLARQTGRVAVCDGSNEPSNDRRSQCNALSQRQVMSPSSYPRRGSYRTSHRVLETLHYVGASPPTKPYLYHPPGHPRAACCKPQ